MSIERLFREVRRSLPKDIVVCSAVSPGPSRGLFPRIRNLLFAFRQRADVHHIVGDVHYLAFALPRRRLVLTIHDCAGLKRLRGLRREVLKYLWFVGPMRRAAVVTTISQSIKEELKDWVGPLAEGVVVVPNCVISGFKPELKPFPLKLCRCLLVGTGWNKNVERVAEALRGTGAQMEVIGRLSEDQRELIEGYGVVFTELGLLSDDDVVEAYRRCDILIFASLYEGFGLPLLEAQSLGRPVITSNRSPMMDVSGEGALFVDPEAVDEIRDAVIRLVENPELRGQLIDRGFENVSRFQPGLVAGMYADLYRGIRESEA